MKTIYFLIMRLFRNKRRIHDWAYLHCFRLYVKNSEGGYWEFANRYLAVMSNKSKETKLSQEIPAAQTRLHPLASHG